MTDSTVRSNPPSTPEGVATSFIKGGFWCGCPARNYPFSIVNFQLKKLSFDRISPLVRRLDEREQAPARDYTRAARAYEREGNARERKNVGRSGDV